MHHGLRRLLALGAIVAVVGACGPSSPSSAPPAATANSTVAPTATAAAPSAVATSAAGDPFQNEPYRLVLPEGWNSFSLSDPASQAALDQFVAANPEFGPAIQAFGSLPNSHIGINPLLGNAIVTIALPSGGLDVATLSQSFDAQFTAVPGLKEVPKAQAVTLPAGPAVHWDLALEANGPSGGTIEVDESIYLAASDSWAVLVEFVALAGGPTPQEQEIINSLAFQG